MAEQQQNKDKGVSPPYAPFDTFKSFTDTLSKTAVPTSIDRSIMPSLSGGAQNQLISALKFLKLIGSLGEVNESLRALVKSYGTATWKDNLNEVIFDAYRPIIGDLDLDTASSKQLVDAFRERGHVDGQMLDKSVRFFIKAMKETGTTYSPHFDTRRSVAPKRNSPPKAPKDAAVPNMPADLGGGKVDPPQKTTFAEALLKKFPDFNPSWDAEQQKAWFESYKTLLSMEKESGGAGS